MSEENISAEIIAVDLLKVILTGKQLAAEEGLRLYPLCVKAVLEAKKQQ